MTSRTQERVASIARDVFTDHELSVSFSEGVRIVQAKRPGSGFYAFRFIETGGVLLFTGDLGDIVLRHKSLDWLVASADSPGYVVSKISAMDGPKIVYDADAARLDLVVIREHYDHENITPEMEREWEEMFDAIKDDFFEVDPRGELQQMYCSSGWYIGGDDIPDFGDYSPTIYWLLEAAKLVGRLSPVEA